VAQSQDWLGLELDLRNAQRPGQPLRLACHTDLRQPLVYVETVRLGRERMLVCRRRNEQCVAFDAAQCAPESVAALRTGQALRLTPVAVAERSGAQDEARLRIQPLTMTDSAMHTRGRGR
jgi:precorrin-6B methylase 1